MSTKSNRPKLTVGQVVYAKASNNYSRLNGGSSSLIPAKVISVGRKYFKIEAQGIRPHKSFSVDDWTEVSEYTPDYVLYASEQEYLDEKESREIYRDLQQRFTYSVSSSNLSLASLRAIKNIIDNDKGITR